MELEILKLVYDYSRNMRIIDTKYIEKLVEVVASSKSLNNYVRNIFWNNELVEMGNGIAMAGYDLINRNLKVNLPSLEMALEHSDKYDHLFNGVEQVFYRNLMFTQFILHELEHANQNKLVDQQGDDLETKLLSASFVTSQTLKNPKLWAKVLNGEISIADLEIYKDAQQGLYQEYYECNPSERLAQIKSFRVIVQLLDQIKDIVPSLNQFENASLVEEMLKGYNQGWDTVECPSQIYLLGTGLGKIWTQFDFFDLDDKKMQEKVNSKYDLGKRLTYGLPVNYAEHCQTQDWLQSTNKFM